jgi:hypothetical protein
LRFLARGRPSFYCEYNSSAYIRVKIFETNTIHMIKRILFLAFVLSASLVSAQEANSKVKQVYSEAQLAAMTSEQLQWNNFLAEELAVIQLAPEKASGLTDLTIVGRKDGQAIDPSTVTITDFNPLMYNFSTVLVQNAYYRVGDTGLVIVVYSQARLEQLFARYKANSK